MSVARSGLLAAALAYFIWGFFPLYWPLLKPATTMEILAHRVLWSLLLVLAVLLCQRRLAPAWRLGRDRRTLGWLGLAAIAIAANWGIYIFAVNSGHTLDASLGYFIMPLVSVLCGVLLFRERLRALQWLAMAIAAGAVVVQALYYGRMPWLSLLLAVSFGSYGLFKKLAQVDTMSGMLLETAALALPAVIYVGLLQAGGNASFDQHGSWHALLLVLGGVITVIPLILLSHAALTVPLSVIGMLQYVTPVLQFLIGWLIQGEAMPASRWLGFVLVWCALLVLSVDALRSAQRRRLARHDGD